MTHVRGCGLLGTDMCFPFYMHIRSPLPFAAGHVPPPVLAHVQLADVIADGKSSVTVAPVTASGPAFEATMVYVVVPPGV